MDLNKLLAQAQQMQQNLAQAQQQLGELEATAQGANGKVQATASADGQLRALTLEPSLLDPEDATFLSDLILKTVQQALDDARSQGEAEMKKHTGGLNIPGL